MVRFWPAAVATVGTLIAVLAALKFSESPRPGPPVLSCPQEVRAAPVERNAPAEARFIVANAGGGELVLSEFRTGCVCEGLEREVDSKFYRFKEIRLAAGESATVRYVRTPDGPGAGEDRSPVWFRTNDPAAPEAFVAVTVQRVGGISLDPTSLAFGSVPLGTVRAKSVGVFDAAVPPRRVDKVVSGDPGRVAVETVPPAPSESPPGAGVSLGQLVVRVNTDGPGQFDTVVSVFVTGRANPETLRVTGRVAAPVEVTPRELHFPRASSAGPIYSADVLVRYPAGGAFAVECPSPPPGVTVAVRPMPGVCRVTVTADPAKASPECVVPLVVRAGAETHAAQVRVVCTPSRATP